jgi:hypothetical protein
VMYVAFVDWLLTVWMVDDSVAALMASQDWYFVAAQRRLVVVGGALAFGVLTYPMNRWCVAPAIPSRPLARS